MVGQGRMAAVATGLRQCHCWLLAASFHVSAPPRLHCCVALCFLAGKYVPSVAHYILSHAASLNGTRSLGRLAPGAANGALRQPLQRRPMPPQLAATRPLLALPPLFDLRGLAIGNGLTDPVAQVGIGGGWIWVAVGAAPAASLADWGIRAASCSPASQLLLHLLSAPIAPAGHDPR